MKRKLLPVLSILLTALLVLPLFASCDGGKNNSTDTSAVSETVSDETSNSRKTTKDNLPVKDFGGRDFVVFCRSEHEYEYGEAETATDFVNDVIQKRNNIVEDRFNVKIKTFAIQGNWGQHTEFFTTLRQHLNSGTDDYQLKAKEFFITGKKLIIST